MEEVTSCDVPADQTKFSQLPTVISYALAVVFCVLATIAVLGISGKVQNYLRPRLGSSHAAVIRYAITNTTKKVLVFQMWSQKTLAIKPGKKDSVLINWNYRGKFHYRMLYHGKTVGSVGTVTIF